MTAAATSDTLLPPLPCTPDMADDFLSTPTPAVVAAVAALPAGPVAILGAGGKMGLHLSLMLKKAALAAGQPERRIIAVSRFATLRDRDSFTDAGIDTIPCDLSVPVNVEALPDAPTVFFLAGVKFGTATSPLLLEQMNVTVPKLVAARYKNSRIVAFSTGCVYPFAPVNTRGCAESTPVAPVGDYAQSCLRREQAFAAMSRDAGTPVVLIRLNYAVEFRYGVLVDIATKVRDGLPVDVTMGHVNVIWQPDALGHIIRSASVAASPAVPLNITGAGVHRVRDLAATFGALFGITPVITGEEAPTAWLNDASHSHHLFGPPPTSLDTMQQWIASWLATGGHTWGKPTGFEKRDGKF
ncbi:nucleoside-diphosphate-sugar epimerase [Opitutaceae bacterium TAV1]|nr:nucleoside-diphosphate-sugar epimerase [Opitutaceae bacterium TAV1]